MNHDLIGLDYFQIMSMYEELIRNAVERKDYKELAGQLTDLTLSIVKAHQHINIVGERPNPLNDDVRHLNGTVRGFTERLDRNERQQQETIDYVTVIGNETALNHEQIKEIQRNMEQQE